MLPDHYQEQFSELSQIASTAKLNRETINDIQKARARNLARQIPENSELGELARIMVAAIYRDFDEIERLLGGRDTVGFSNATMQGNFNLAMVDSFLPLNFLNAAEKSISQFEDDIDLLKSVARQAIAYGFLDLWEQAIFKLEKLNAEISEDDCSDFDSIENVRKAKASLGISDREIAEYIDVAAKPLRAYFSNDLKLDCMTSLSYLGASGEELLCIDIEVNADTEDLERLNEQVADELSAHSFGVNVEKYFFFTLFYGEKVAA
jgi:hypothetical protein